MKNSKIAWTDDTYNPIRVKGGSFYCSKISAGCTNCYAEISARRLAGAIGVLHEPYTARKEYPEMELNRDMLANWAKKIKPRMNFVSSMTDICGEFVPDQMFFDILDAMRAAPLQTFQILTKRARRGYELVIRWLFLRNLTALPGNIWFGMSIEDQPTADERIHWLAQIPCKIKWLSIEPLLAETSICSAIRLFKFIKKGHFSSTNFKQHIQWVVVGGESGNKARMMERAWVLKLFYECWAANVPFFFKQWGQHEPDETGQMRRVKVKSHEALLDGVAYHEFPVTS